MFKILVLALITFSLNAFSYPDECKGREDEFINKINTFTQKKLNSKTIFSGSSSILMWKKTHKYFPTLYKNIGDQNYYNRGFGGSQVCHLLINYKKIFLGSSNFQNPKRIVIYSGDNDLANKLSPKKIVGHYKLLIQKIRSEGITSPIYFIAVKPSPKRMYMVDLIKKVGELMKVELEKISNIYVINQFSEFFDEAGKIKMHYYLSDELHLKPVVYEMWAKKLEALWKKH